MRLLRALVHLVLVLTVVTTAAAQARAFGVMPVSAHEQHSNHVMAADEGDVAHHCDTPMDKQPSHNQDSCNPACCVMPAQVPAYVATAFPDVFRAAHYRAAPFHLLGRGHAPDPGIPKTSA